MRILTDELRTLIDELLKNQTFRHDQSRGEASSGRFHPSATPDQRPDGTSAFIEALKTSFDDQKEAVLDELDVDPAQQEGSNLLFRGKLKRHTGNSHIVQVKADLWAEIEGDGGDERFASTIISAVCFPYKGWHRGGESVESFADQLHNVWRWVKKELSEIESDMSAASQHAHQSPRYTLAEGSLLQTIWPLFEKSAYSKVLERHRVNTEEQQGLSVHFKAKNWALPPFTTQRGSKIAVNARFGFLGDDNNALQDLDAIPERPLLVSVAAQVHFDPDANVWREGIGSLSHRVPHAGFWGLTPRSGPTHCSIYFIEPTSHTEYALRLLAFPSLPQEES